MLFDGGDPGTEPDIENIIGSPFSDNLTGNALANRINVLDGILDTADCVGPANGNSAIADEVGVDVLSNCETVDNAPQTLVTGGPANGATSTNPTQAYTLSSDEPASFQYRVDSGPFQPCPAACTVPGIPDGAHTIGFRAVDLDENLSADQTPATRVITIDTVAPDTLISGKRKLRTRKKKARASFTLTSTEPAASFECSVDSRPFSPCVTPFSIKLRPGAHKVTVRSKDAVGNQDATPATLALKVKRI